MTFKKFIAAILLFTLILQSFPVTVYAAEKDDDDSNSSNTETVYYEEEDLGYSPYPDASWVQNPNSGITWDEYFGGVANIGFPLRNMPLVSLENGLQDFMDHGSYTAATPPMQRYLLTPFSEEDAIYTDAIHPGYGGSMNCTSFFVWLVLNMGISKSQYISMTGGGSFNGMYSLRRVTNTFRGMANAGQLIMYNFPSFEAAQASGKLKKGDIMILEPSTGGHDDHHFTVFWGDTPYENLVWHSINYSAGAITMGDVAHFGNLISTLPDGSHGRRVWTFPNSVFEFYIYLEKEPGTPDLPDGSQVTIKNVRENETLLVATVDKNGHVKDIKTKENDRDFQIDIVRKYGKRYIRIMEHEDGARIYHGTTDMQIQIEHNTQTCCPNSSTVSISNGLNNAATIHIMEDIDYSLVYDYNYYINKYPDMRRAYANDKVGALTHFINHGMAEGRQAKGTFDVQSYKNRYADLRQNFGYDLKKYYIHYINHGYKEGRSGTGCYQLINPITVYNGVDYGRVYDFKYYINKYPDMKNYYANDDIGAIKHFVEHGMAEGRQGKDTFDVKTYKNMYPDLRNNFGNDLKKYYIHFMNHGYKENRKATGGSEIIKPVTILNGVDYGRVYDYDYYLNKYPDMKKYYAADDVAALTHFVNHGMAEGRQGKANFELLSYKLSSPDLRKYYGKDNKKYYIHYMNSGYKENRKAVGVTKMVKPTTVLNGVDYSAVYDFEYYLNRYPDMKKYYQYDDEGALRHFVEHGMAEGRQGNSTFDVYSYKNAYPDLRKNFLNDYKKYYIHYVNYGRKENRVTSGVTSIKNPVTVYNNVDYSKVYDFNYYINKYPDMKKIYQNDDMGALRHFVLYGIKEGRQGSANFNLQIYRQSSPDLQKYYGFANENNIKYVNHYIYHGYKENRKAK